MEELLECSVCMDPFDSSALRTPKMLPCQHSFCFNCLTRMYQSCRVTCPTCRKIYATRIEDIPNNFILLQLVDVQNRRRKDNEMKAACQKCRKNNKKVSKHCQDCLDAVVGDEVARVVELMQGVEKGDFERSKLRKRRPVIISKQEPSETPQQSSSDLFDFMRTITILLAIFSVVIVIGFKSSPFFVTIRCQLNELFSSIFYQLSTFLKLVAKTSRKALPDVISAIKNLMAILFQNLIMCLSVIVQFVHDIAPSVGTALSHVTIFLAEVFVSFVKVLLQLCLVVLSAAGNAFLSVFQ